MLIDKNLNNLDLVAEQDYGGEWWQLVLISSDSVLCVLSRTVSNTTTVSSIQALHLLSSKAIILAFY